MAKCKYCGKDAGIFSSAHKECEEFARETCDYFTQLAMHAFLNGGDETELRNALNTAGREANLSPKQLEQAALNAITQGVAHAMEDGIVTSEEEKNLVMLTRIFKIPEATLHRSEVWSQLVKSRVLADIIEGKTPKRFQAGNLNVVLQKDESVIWAFGGVSSHEMKTRKYYVGGSVGLSVKVAKGVYLRTSAFRGQPVETSELVHSDTGILIVTKKHVFFQGGIKVVKMPVGKLAAVEPYTDGIGLQLDTASAKMRLFKNLDGWFAYNLVTNLTLL